MSRYIDADGLIRVLKSFTEYMSAEENDDVIKGLEKAICCADEYSNKFQHRGKWIERWHENKHTIGDMACSVCGAKMLLTFPKFCPNCGSVMDEKYGKA